jgi:hypothetical protein
MIDVQVFGWSYKKNYKGLFRSTNGLQRLVNIFNNFNTLNINDWVYAWNDVKMFGRSYQKS